MLVSETLPGAAGRIVLQHPVNIGDIDASGHHICTHQDPTETKHRDKNVKSVTESQSDSLHLYTHTHTVSQSVSQSVSPFQGPKVCKDLVAFMFHLAVDAVDRNLLHQNLQSSTVVLHTGTRAEEEQQRVIPVINFIIHLTKNLFNVKASNSTSRAEAVDFKPVTHLRIGLNFWPNVVVVESVVWQNAATSICCEAPKMFCELQNFTWLSISMIIDR